MKRNIQESLLVKLRAKEWVKAVNMHLAIVCKCSEEYRQNAAREWKHAEELRTWFMLWWKREAYRRIDNEK